MNLDVQVECDTLVCQHQAAFAQVRRDVVAAVMKTAELWEPVFFVPTLMHGQLHCTSVRGLLIKVRMDRESANGVDGTGSVVRRPLQKGGLRTRCGQGMSVVLCDGRGGEIRVRKAPSRVVADRDRLVIYPGKQQHEAAKEIVEAGAADRRLNDPDSVAPVDGDGEPEPQVIDGQYTLGGEFDRLAPKPTGYDWFVLWTLSADALHVPEVFLAAVIGIDDSSSTTIVASTALPKEAAPRSDQAEDDFEDFGEDGEEGTGPTPA